MISLGIDIGYNAVKACGDRGKLCAFPSVVGSPEQARFSLSPEGSGIVLSQPVNIAVGDAAISQSRWLRRREDRSWIGSDEWRALWLAAVSELVAGSAEAVAVLGLPLAYYSDKAAVRDSITGDSRFQREGRRAQTVKIVEARVVPQPFGAVLNLALDSNGAISDPDLAKARLGVIDVGGHTTNLLSVDRLSEVAYQSASVSVGGWDAVRALRTVLDDQAPGLSLRDPDIAAALVARGVHVYGRWLDLSKQIDRIVEPMAATVIGQASQLWNGAANLQRVIVAGGGALLLGDYLTRHFPHAAVIPDPVQANARGFWKLARRVASATSA